MWVVANCYWSCFYGDNVMVVWRRDVVLMMKENWLLWRFWGSGGVGPGVERMAAQRGEAWRWSFFFSNPWLFFLAGTNGWCGLMAVWLSVWNGGGKMGFRVIVFMVGICDSGLWVVMVRLRVRVREGKWTWKRLISSGG
jgi:hypothetical protein